MTSAASARSPRSWPPPRARPVPRLVVVGGAGSLEVAPGVQLVDTPTFPEAYKPYALAHREAFNRLQAVDDLDWTFFSPAAEIGPGEERGQYRVQPKAFLADASGHSRISYADYGAAFVAELEAHAVPEADHHRSVLITHVPCRAKPALGSTRTCSRALARLYTRNSHAYRCPAASLALAASFTSAPLLAAPATRRRRRRRNPSCTCRPSIPARRRCSRCPRC
jgi:hypothetical protein